jgi:hypothetical protein
VYYTNPKGAGADKEDVAQWIAYYQCLHHEDAFLAAASSLGLPIVQKMSPHTNHVACIILIQKVPVLIKKT